MPDFLADLAAACGENPAAAALLLLVLGGGLTIIATLSVVIRRLYGDLKATSSVIEEGTKADLLVAERLHAAIAVMDRLATAVHQRGGGHGDD